MPERKLILDEYGVAIPVAGETDPLRLNEPTLPQFAEIRRILREADQRLDDECGTDQAARKSLAYDDPDKSPHAQAFIRVVEMLTRPSELAAAGTGRTLVSAQLFGWAASPATLGEIYNHAIAPLGGRVSNAMQALSMIEAMGRGVLATPSAASSSPNGANPSGPSSPASPETTLSSPTTSDDSSPNAASSPPTPPG